MASQPESAEYYRNQNSFVCTLVPSVHRAIDRHDTARVLGPVAVLDGNRFGDETNRVQKLLQRASHSRRVGGKDADRNAGLQRSTVQILSVAKALSWAIPNADCGINANSPCTGIEIWFGTSGGPSNPTFPKDFYCARKCDRYRPSRFASIAGASNAALEGS
jgi:hypothetical protein